MRKLKYILVIGTVLGLLLFLTTNIWLPRMLALYTLHELRESHVESVPVPRQLETKDLSAKIFTVGDIEFRSPWTDVVKVRGNSTSSITINFGSLSSTSTKAISLYKNVNLHDHLIRTSSTVQEFFGLFLQTNYQLYSHIVNLTPKDVSVLSPNSELLPMMTLLILKSKIIPYLDKPIYSFTTKNNIQGFQYTRSATSTLIEFFSPSDQEYTLLILGATAQELDSILQSVKENP